MSSHPIVTAEELACLLAMPAAAQQQAVAPQGKAESLLVHAGAALWLGKVLFLYVVLQTIGMDALPLRYLGARMVLEALCAAVFWCTLRHPARRTCAVGALLVGGTTFMMDALVLLALPA